ncbi:hypothetical protein ABZ401_12890 [Streptomyces sp. NPDC005892]|uniref:hypothetical protein n=1 Tax=Streptomyces sp. NPDC005892 TaxID=3155593 RepID=UPI0033E78D3C
MSLHLIPRRTKPARHRLASRAELQQELQQLRSQVVGASTTITALDTRLAEASTQRAEAEQVVLCLGTELDDRTAERDQALAEAAYLRAQLAPYLAAEANNAAITVPDAVRDTTAVEDQATTPIDVRPLWEALNAGRIVRVADAPPADDPRTPTWAPGPDSETTQSLRVVAA